MCRKRIIISIAFAVLFTCMLTFSAFAYTYRFEARLGAMSIYADTSLTEGPVLGAKEFYGALLDPYFNNNILEPIIGECLSGYTEDAKNQWCAYFKTRVDTLYLSDYLGTLKTPEQLTVGDVNLTLANNGKDRIYVYGGTTDSFYRSNKYDWTYNATYDPVTKTTGNVEWVRTLNQHKWWAEMAKAAIVYSDDTYAVELANQIKSWITTQIPGLKSVGQEFTDNNKQFVWYSQALNNNIINYGANTVTLNMTGTTGNNLAGNSASWMTRDTGKRLMEWVKVLYYFKQSSYFDAKLCDLITRSIIDQIEWLGNIPYHYSEGYVDDIDWPESEAKGLFCASKYVPEYIMSDKMLALAEQRIGVYYECEDLVTSTSTGITESDVQISGASNGYINLLSSNGDNDYVEYTVSVAQPGAYRIYIGQRTFYNRGIYQLSIDSINQSTPIDQYAETPAFIVSDLGQVDFALSGNKTFRFTVIGTSGTGRRLAFDYIRLVKQ